MPTNITRGNTAQFTVEFFDASGNLAIPSSATITVTYIPIGTLSPTTLDIGMTPVGSVFVGLWDTTGAALQLASYVVNAPNELTTPAGSGQLRIIDP